MEAWRCARVLAVMAESLFVDQERRLMDQRRVRTSRLPPLSTRENPCLGAGGCRGGFVGGDLFRVSRYVSTGARELVRDIERKMRHCVDARNPFQATFNLSISVLRKLWKSFVWGFHTSGAIRRNQTQSGAIRRNQTHSDAISMPGALCFRVFVFWAGRKGLCFVFLCFEPAQRACVLCFRVLADPPQNTARGQDLLILSWNQLMLAGSNFQISPS